LFEFLEKVNHRPEPFEVYTAKELWTDKHTSKQMLSCHLNDQVDLSSRNAEFMDRSVDWICSRFNVDSQTWIADFGCGPGLYASRLARRGARVTGIDFSASSIQYARQTAAGEDLPIEYVCQDYLLFESDQLFDLILMIYCDLCALSPEQRSRMLGKYQSLLAPGGAVLLDVHSLSFFEQREEQATYGKNLQHGFWSADDYYGFLTTFNYQSQHVTLDKYTIVERDRTRTVYNWLQCFSPDDLRREMEAAGLQVTEILGDVAGAPYSESSWDFAVIATGN
jgi:cyclopropane fatty-acyl-phospholipid synthase-like methyltransferase